MWKISIHLIFLLWLLCDKMRVAVSRNICHHKILESTRSTNAHLYSFVRDFPTRGNNHFLAKQSQEDNKMASINSPNHEEYRQLSTNFDNASFTPKIICFRLSDRTAIIGCGTHYFQQSEASPIGQSEANYLKIILVWMSHNMANSWDHMSCLALCYLNLKSNGSFTPKLNLQPTGFRLASNWLQTGKMQLGCISIARFHSHQF